MSLVVVALDRGAGPPRGEDVSSRVEVEVEVEMVVGMLWRFREEEEMGEGGGVISATVAAGVTAAAGGEEEGVVEGAPGRREVGGAASVKVKMGGGTWAFAMPRVMSHLESSRAWDWG